MYSPKRRFRLFRDAAWSGGAPPVPETTYDTLTLTLDGTQNGYVTKYTQDGRVVWVTRITAPGGNTTIQAVENDTSGNIFVAGIFTNTSVVIYNANGTQNTTLTLTDGSLTDGYLIKYNSSGMVQWVAQITGMDTVGIGSSSLRGIKIDSSGNIYLIGNLFSGDFAAFYSADGSSFINSSYYMFLVKYTSSGVPTWNAGMISSSLPSANQLVLDSSGNIYICGTYTSAQLDIYDVDGNIPLSLAVIGGADAFIVKYSSLGYPIWAAKIAGTATDAANSISIDSSNNVYVVGSYQSAPVTIYDKDDIAFGTLARSGTSLSDAFIVKYTSGGAVSWITRIGSTGSDTLFDVITDSSGNTYVVGQYGASPLNFYSSDTNLFRTLTRSGASGTDSFIAKYDSSGNGIWAAKVASTGSESGRGVALDISGNVFFSGTFTATATAYDYLDNPFTPTIPFSAGTPDLFLVKYDSIGNVSWVTRIHSGGVDALNQISKTVSSNVVLVGTYNATPITFRSTGF